METENDDELNRARAEWVALEEEYSQKFVNAKPLPINRDIEPMPYEELSELTAKVQAAKQRYLELQNETRVPKTRDGSTDSKAN